MAPSRKKGGRSAAAAAGRQQWKVGDLVLAKMKGFPAWPAVVSEPEKWGYSSDRKKLLVYFYGTKQIAFCNYADIEAFTEEKKKSLLVKRQGKGANFVRAVDEIIDIYDKKQILAEVNSSNEGNNPTDGHLEDSRGKTSRNSPEDNSHVNDNHQSEAVCASTKNSDVINPEVPRTSTERDPQDTSTLNGEPTEKVSILNQLRKTPLSTTTTARKRQRDGSLPSSVVQTMPSLRRSRSSSGGDPYKLQKSSVRGKSSDQSDNNVVPNVLQEETTLKKLLSGDGAHVVPCSNVGLPGSAGFPSSDYCEDAVSDKTATKSDSEEVGMFELEQSKNGYLNKDLGLNGVTLNGIFDLPIKAAIHKKKRKPNRKRVTNTLECATLEKEVELQIELHGSLSVSSNSRKELAESFSKADGDEHLPLVKRARVRMGKPSVEETQLNEYVEKKEKLELVASLEESDICAKSSSSLSSPADGTPLRVKEAQSSLLVNDCALTPGGDSMVWKVNKFQFKGITVDVEAALPPSKRLHRALEAMSANAAEAVDDTPQGSSGMEVVCNDCIGSLREDPLHLPVDVKTESPPRSHCIQSSEKNASYNDTSGLSSSLASLHTAESMLSLLKVEPDNILTQSSGILENNDSEEVVGVKDCDESSNSKISAIDTQGKVLRSCSSKSFEGPISASSGEGASAQLCSPLGGTSLPSKERSYPQVEGVNESGSMEPDVEKPDPVMNSKEGNKLLPPNGTVGLLATNVASGASNASESTKCPSSPFSDDIQARYMSDAMRQVKHKVTSKDWGTSDLTPMKDLIAAAQAKRLLSQSTLFPDNVVDGKVFADSVISPSVNDRSDSSVRGSLQNSMVYHRPATDDMTHNLQNGSRSPFAGQRDKGSNKLAAPMEANVALRSFEALLCILSRTKDSIGRATRVAIDCAKYGIAGEVIEILLQHLERESSLYKRVDLFFLVDSITQFSRSQKGGVGDVYLSLVQSMLPRLLNAAAPHGDVAWENRRQCLKVLRLWLERKTLPESIVRHHIRELESVNETSLTSSYSRRPSRMERALNDPIREMEGMFVDEYGSNTSFQLQHFIHPRLLEDEEGSGDDEKSFEAVTPERNVEVEDEKGTAQTPSEKHRHVLEDVDGELEMEDVAPPCGVEASSTRHVSGAETISGAYHHHEQQKSLPCAPPLPEDLPPSPPPLPSSPPPIAPPCPAPNCLPQEQFGGSHVNADVTDFHLSSTHNNQNQQQHPVSQQTNNYHGNLTSSESMPYYTHGYGGVQSQIPPVPCSLRPSGPFTSHTAVNNFQPKISTSLPKKGYPLQPPPPRVSNQFSYIQAEAQQRSSSWDNCSSFGDTFQYVHGSQGGNLYCDGNVRGPIQHENAGRGRFSPTRNTGPILSDKAETYSTHSRYGPYPESASNPSHGWSFPPRISSYSSSASRSSLENPMSRVTGAPGCWRPR